MGNETLTPASALRVSPVAEASEHPQPPPEPDPPPQPEPPPPEPPPDEG
jgi:periplasmic protein TonB